MTVKELFAINFDGDIVFFSKNGYRQIARWSQAEYRCDDIDGLLDKTIVSATTGDDVELLVVIDCYCVSARNGLK